MAHLAQKADVAAVNVVEALARSQRAKARALKRGRCDPWREIWVSNAAEGCCLARAVGRPSASRADDTHRDAGKEQEGPEEHNGQRGCERPTTDGGEEQRQSTDRDGHERSEEELRGEGAQAHAAQLKAWYPAQSAGANQWVGQSAPREQGSGMPAHDGGTEIKSQRLTRLR